MTPSPRFKLTALLAIGLAGLVAIVGSFRGRQKGVSYYFPAWASRAATTRELDDRFRELTNSPRCLEIMLQAVSAEPTPLGAVWDDLWIEFPEPIQQVLPYYNLDYRPPFEWLLTNSRRPETAAGVAKAWPEWPAWLRAQWMTSVALSGTDTDAIYRRLAYLTTATAAEHYAAARLLASGTPLTDAEANFIAGVIQAHAMSNAPPSLVAWEALEQLGADLVGARVTHPSIFNALAGLLGDDTPGRPISAVVLCALNPAQWPAEVWLPPRFAAAAQGMGNQGYGVRMLAWPEFNSLASSPPCLDILGDQLTARWTTNTSSHLRPWSAANRPSSLAVRILNALGTNASALAPRLLGLLQQEPSVAGRDTAEAFVSIAPCSSANVTAILPLLTNRQFVTPLLLWLTQAGTNAALAAPAVRQIGDGTVLYANSYRDVDEIAQDPLLAGRLELTSSPDSPPNRKDANALLPATKFVVSVNEECPVRFLHLWPGGKPRNPLNAGSGSVIHRSRARREDVYAPLNASIPLATLAWQCLHSLTNGVPADAAQLSGAAIRSFPAQ